MAPVYRVAIRPSLRRSGVDAGMTAHAKTGPADKADAG